MSKKLSIVQDKKTEIQKSLDLNSWDKQPKPKPKPSQQDQSQSDEPNTSSGSSDK